MKRVMMIAGPNGAGKTTIASALTSQQKDIYEEFINADQIAQEILSRLKKSCKSLFANSRHCINH